MLTRVLALFAILSIPAWPAATLVLTPNVEIGMPGDEVIFDGTFSVDPGDPDTFFTDLAFNFTSPAGSFLTPDMNIFFINAATALCANDPLCQTHSFGDAIFGIQIAPATPFGNYFGTVTMLGGADPGASDPLIAAVPFEVDVVSPEPATFLMIIPLFAAGLAALRKKPATH